jgi:hypothetical protein
VRNSTSGEKRIASIGRNFVSFEDRAGVRWIDLVSVLDKRQGIAVKILAATIGDARRDRLEEVKGRAATTSPLSAPIGRLDSNLNARS